MGGLGDHIRRLPPGLGDYLEPGALDGLKPAELKALQAEFASQMPSTRELLLRPLRVGDYAEPPGKTGDMWAYHPSWREQIAQTLADTFGTSRYGKQYVSDKVLEASDFVPVVNQVLSANEMKRSAEAGNWRDFGINLGATTLAAIPLAGGLLGKAAKKGARSLAMDTASRMERAASMGFRTDTPIYHGSARKFSAFDPAKRGSSTGTPAAHIATWHSLDPESANFFADVAARKRRGQHQQLYPLFYRTSNPAEFTLRGHEPHRAVAATVDDAFAKGHDSVLIRNYNTQDGKKGTDILAVRDPEQLRSWFAKFDPAKILSRNLLAGFSGLSGAGMALSQMRNEREKR
jgi:hypothetical protein